MFLKFSLILFCSFIIQKKFLGLGHHLGLYSQSNFRRKKNESIPLTGGIGIFLSIIVGYFFYPSTELALLLICAVPLVMASIADDFFELSARLKLPFQIISAILFCFISGPESLFYSQLLGSPLLGFFISTLFIVTLINAYNFLDGSDGHLGVIAFVAIATIGILRPQDVIQLSIIALSVAVFFWFNRPPAKIYLGDVGSSLLGFLVAGLCLKIEPAQSAWASFWCINFLLSLAFVDFLVAVVRRVKRGEPPWKGDREHFHHILTALGFSQWQLLSVSGATMVISSVIGITVLKLSYGIQTWALVFVGVSSLSLLYLGFLFLEKITVKKTNDLFRFILKKQKSTKSNFAIVSEQHSFLEIDLQVYAYELQSRSILSIEKFIFSLIQIVHDCYGKISWSSDLKLYIQLPESKQKEVVSQMDQLFLDFRVLRNEASASQGLSVHKRKPYFNKVNEIQIISNKWQTSGASIQK